MPPKAKRARAEATPEPRVIVCYGDSNTFGASGLLAGWPSRLPYASRWTTILQSRLGDEFLVTPEGLNGRTTCMDDEHCWSCCDGAPGGMNGRKCLLPILHSHKPVEVVVIALGCNDLKTYFALEPSQIASCCQLLINDIKKSTSGPDGQPPKILLITPPHVKDTSFPKLTAFGPKRERRSLETAAAYEALAKDEGLRVVNLTTLRGAAVSEDGLHFDEVASKAIGAAVETAVRQVLSDP